MRYLFNFIRIGVSAFFAIMLYKYYGFLLAAAFSFIYIQMEFVLFFASSLFKRSARLADQSKEFHKTALGLIEKVYKDALTRAMATESALRRLIEAMNGV
jgi:hypothetical protein